MTRTLSISAIHELITFFKSFDSWKYLKMRTIFYPTGQIRCLFGNNEAAAAGPFSDGPSTTDSQVGHPRMYVCLSVHTQLSIWA